VRWDSTYLMLIDFETNYDKFEKVKDYFDYWVDRATIRNIIQILQISYLQTKDLSANNYITVSLVPIYIFKSLKALQPDENDNQFCKNLRSHLLKEYKKKFEWILNDTTSKNIYLLSACLDPRYGNLEFVDLTTRDLIWNTLYEDIIDLKFTSEEEKEMDILKHKESVIKSSLQLLRATFEKKKSELNKMNPLDWWKKNEVTLSILVPYVKLTLCTMATSAPCERTFKSTSFLYNENRSMLDEENVEKMVFIRENYDLIRGYTMKQLLEMIQSLKNE